MSQTGEAKAQKIGVAGKQARLRRDFWPKLKRNLARIPFAEDLVAAYFCALDPATPIRAKAILLGALAYFVMPADLVPDFLIALGFVDDAAVLMAAINAIGANLKPHHRARARQVLISTPKRSPDANFLQSACPSMRTG
jgi:uncharacterized membrane protein YkvA (DUF1232 family)